MMNETFHNETPPNDATDGEVERLLVDAYKSPPLPVSLVDRLDRMIAEEWGSSPGLVVTRATPLQRFLSAGPKWFRAARIVGYAAMVVVGVLLFGRGSPAFAWASVVEALEQKGVVQLENLNVTRWLSLSNGVVSERAGPRLILLDTRQNVVLERNDRNLEIQRRKLARRQHGSDRDGLVLAFLIGNADHDANFERFVGSRLIDQRWEYSRQGKKKVVLLDLRWETEQSEKFDFRLTLDPVTRLPIESHVVTNGLASADSMSWSYPATSVSELRAKSFPTDFTIVDVNEAGKLRDVAENDVALGQGIGNDALNRAAVAVVEAGDDQSPTVGATSRWRPVNVISQSRDEVVAKIDSILDQLWQTNHVDPAPPADEEELLRRVYLDLTGRTPSVHEIRSYLSDRSPNRYEQLVDRLLQNRDHASHLATVWRTFLIPDGVDLAAFGGAEGFDRWMAERFGDNEPYDQIVRQLLLAEGRLSRSGPLLFYSAVKLDPDQLASRTARVFLGMRLECAQCHDHPFESWKQEEFWGFAAFFAQISRPQGELQSVSTVMQVHDVDHGEVKLPKTDSVIAPRFLDGRLIASHNLGTNPTESRRQQLANWVTAADNPYFGRATANRVWSVMFGKGIVDPADDFGVRHQPKSPHLLELVAGHFLSSGFDLRELFRTIALTRAYRLSSGAATTNPVRQDLFAQMNVKPFSAEQVYDCMTVATLLDNVSAADPFAFNVSRYGNSDRALFLSQFRTPTGRSTEYLGGIPQALTLMNGTLIDNATGLSKSGLLKSLEAPFFTNPQRVEVLYLATLSRRPRPSEWQLLSGLIGKRTSESELRENLSDILWALLNSAEFTMNH